MTVSTTVAGDLILILDIAPKDLLGPVALILGATIAFVGSAWQFARGRTKEIEFRVQELQKQKYEQLLAPMVKVFAHTGDRTPPPAEDQPASPSTVAGVTREQWMAANMDVGLFASDQFIEMFNEYQRGLLRNDDFYVSARRMGELFVQIRRDVGFGQTEVSARDILSTIITDIYDSRYEYVFQGEFPRGARPSRPIAPPAAGRAANDVYVAAVEPAGACLQRWQERLTNLDMSDLAEDFEAADTTELLTALETCLSELDDAGSVLASVDVPPQAQHLQQIYVALCAQWIDAMTLALDGVNTRRSESIALGFDKWGSSQQGMVDAHIASTALLAGVTPGELSDWLDRVRQAQAQAAAIADAHRLNRRDRRAAANRRGT